MPRVKICGIKETEHAIYASKLNVDYLGFVFVENVRRQLTQDTAYELIENYREFTLRESPSLVGLFANQSLKFVNDTVRKCKLDMVQLCGAESLDFCKLIDVPVIKQIKVDKELIKNKSKIIDSIIEVINYGSIPILDHSERGKLGGTGHSFDWSVIEGLSVEYDFILAGGLNPSNVRQAIRKVNPWGLDVSSGIETNGVKDKTKILEFINKIREK
ncbi:MAG: N-(5'-phosphoribosyl)anthranilate isomerase [Chloroflexi bacterium]|nr:N-(5'-phosphoribosyl)anthranilate isomerase [Chloroflexota bacterium]|tara:strand:+ start:25274 stop:25921 length:648 start_codon:yes stop_codon:yes gene_type:complete